MDIIEENIFCTTSDNLELEAILAYPDDTPANKVILLLGPHPHFGGNINNNVIKTLAQGLAESGTITLRFNYRGVGKSEIHLPEKKSTFEYYETMEQERKYDALLPDAVATHRYLRKEFPDIPLHVIGYSFGALLGGMFAKEHTIESLVAISPPINRVEISEYISSDTPAYFIGGDKDFTFTPAEFMNTVSKHNKLDNLLILPDSDHFYRGQEKKLLSVLKIFLLTEK